MQVVEQLHGGYVHPRRVRVLAQSISELVQPDSRLLDVGCGDGLVAREVAQRRPDIHTVGIDVLVRTSARIPVSAFDGQNIPFPDGAFDSVMLIDVLHHSDDPKRLLAEATRVARSELILKDHLMDRPLSAPILRFMDRVGNERHGVESVYNYWSTARWHAAFEELGLDVMTWVSDPPLYPWPANLVFGRGLHFIAKLVPRRR
jgi:ubiquinone/menaquinone biosynthesis C-methylase UbiE